MKGEKIMLFEDNLGFVKFNISAPTDNDLTTVEDGFNRGNMFKSLYKPYKNYRYAKVVPENKEKELLYEIMALSFAINDLDLYLDLHPEDTEMLVKFKSLVEKSIKKEMEYVNTYGPLELTDNLTSNRFTWVKNPWPWDNTGGVKYV